MSQLDADLLHVTNPSAHRYTTQIGGFAELRRKLLIRMGVTVPIIIGMAYMLGYYRIGVAPGWPGAITYLVPLVVVVYSSFNAIKKQRIQFESFTLTLEDDAIVRQQKGLPDMRILKKDIRSIKKNAEGIIIIKGAGFQDVLSIPAQVEARRQLEAELTKISPIGISNSSAWKRSLSIISMLALLAVSYIAFTASNPWVIAISGLIFFGGFATSIIQAVINKHLDRRVRFGMAIAIIPLLTFSSTIYSRWKSASAHNTSGVNAVEQGSSEMDTP